MADEARIPRLTLDEAKAAAEQAGVPDMLADLSVFQIALRHPPLAEAMYELLAALMFTSKLDARLRELVIMRLGWATGSVYEWTQHWRIAQGTGLSDDDILGVRDWRNHAGYGPAERAVLAAVDETLDTGTISDETWAACKQHVTADEARLELVVAIGHWRMYSSLLRSLKVPLEDGVDPWPPDGREP